jgi:hypothetical protein
MCHREMAKCRVWTERATRKIMKNDKMERRWWFEDSSLELIRDYQPWYENGKLLLWLSAARNEFESGQIVVGAAEGDLNNVELEWTELKGPGGSTIGPENIQMFFVHYIYLPYRQKEYPDGLTPLKPFSVKKGENQPVWFDVYVPKNTPPGMYEGKVYVRVDGLKVTEVILKLKVRDFELSDTPPMPTAIGITPDCLWRLHEVSEDSPEAVELYASYYEFFLQHRISTHPHLSRGKLWPVSVHDERAAEIYNDPRVTTVRLYYTHDYEELKRTIEVAEEKGFLHKCFFYLVDEPSTEEQFAFLRKARKVLDSIRPGLRILTPFHRGPEFAPEDSPIDHLKNISNPLCTITWRLDIPSERQKIMERKEAGITIWWYVCCAPETPYCNFLVDMEALDPRMLFWQQKAYDIEGLVYYSGTFWHWEIVDNPWTDMATWKSYSDIIYGDGSLTYPGKPVGVDGPCASIRLKLIRKGINDYEYLCLLEKKRGKDYVKNLLSGMIKNLSTYERHAHKLDEMRDRIAEELEME